MPRDKANYNAWMRKYRATHKRTCAETSRRSYKKNIGKRKTYERYRRVRDCASRSAGQKAWREKNKEWLGFWRREYNRANPEIKRSAAKRYRQKYPHKIIAHVNNRRCRLLNATPSWLTKDQFKQMECFYLKARELSRKTGIKYSVDHVWPLCGGNFSGLNVPWNLRVIPLCENFKKNNKSPEGYCYGKS